MSQRIKLKSHKQKEFQVNTWSGKRYLQKILYNTHTQRYGKRPLEQTVLQTRDGLNSTTKAIQQKLLKA